MLRGALGSSRFGFRQACWAFKFVGILRRLTIRSSRPHVVASAMCFTLRLHMSAAPPRVGLTQALYAVKQRLAWVRCSCDFNGHHAVPQSSTARISELSAHAARLSARRRSVQLFAPECIRLVMLFAPTGVRSGSAALWASVVSHGRELFSLQIVFTGSRLRAPTNPRNILTSLG
jgi:hypothetical protein